MAKYKRKHYFIDKKLQTKYIVITILLLIVYTFLFVVILLFPHIMALSSNAPLGEQTEAARTLLTLHQSIWPALGVVMLIMGSASIFITHKMAGPVYRFKKVLAEVSGGNLDISVKLREKDDFKDLAEDLNVVIAELRTFVRTAQKNEQTMSACINELEDQIKSNEISREVGQQLIERLQQDREVLAQILSKYSK